MRSLIPCLMSLGLLAVPQVSMAQTVAAPAPAAPAAPVLLEVDSAASTLHYKIVHKLKETGGTSKKAEGRVALLPDGRVQVLVRASVASFDSGNSSRDSHMLETMEAARFPLVQFKGEARVTPPAAYPAKVEVTVSGELEFHGRKRRESIPVSLSFSGPGEVRATGRFNVSLDAYEVERPSLLLMKIDDACEVTLDLVARGKK